MNMFGEAQEGLCPWTARSILAVLASRMGVDQMLVDYGSVQKTSRNHKSD